MSPLEELTELLSKGLNRNVTNTFLTSILRLYKLNTSKFRFTDAVSALGISPDLASPAYIFINDNIGELERSSGSSAEKQVPKKVTFNPNEALTKRQLLDLEFEDDLDLPNVPTRNTTSTGVVAGNDKNDKPKKVIFKKIKKETAQKIKAPPKEMLSLESGPTEIRSIDGQSSKTSKDQSITKPQSDKLQDSVAAISEASYDSDVGSDASIDIDNDRTWYDNEDFSACIVDQYSDLTIKTNITSSRSFKTGGGGRTGGSFDTSGAYVDYDHDESYSQQRIAIVPHFIVPTFLRGSEEYLKLQLDSSRTTRSLGPSVNPIKDPESELALSAKSGSFAVKNWKERQERAQQAKDRVGQEKTQPTKGEPDGPVPDATEEDASYSFEEIQKQRKSLPAYKVKEDLMRVISENQIVVVIGETGSGKTTQLTQFLVESGYTKDHKLVACTQPRRVAAMSVAKRVSEEMGVKLGQEVGYTIRFEDKTNPKKTIVKYMTEGILLREILEDPNLDKYSCIIMDEAHERSLNTDVLLGLFKQLVRRRRDLKLIITSATMNADRFTQFFGNAPQFFISGRTFPVEVFYSKIGCSDYVETAVKQVVTIHLANQKSDGDILVFMTGQEDIEATCELIKEKLELLENPPPLDVYPIYSTLPADVQKKIFTRQNSERRKVVVATNIAETSLTVDGIKYVVDCGLVKLKLFNPKLGMDVLQIVPISLANAQQRSGRAGRTAAGMAYRLYTEKAADILEMYLQPIPEIQRANLSSVMLLLKNLKVMDVLKFPFLDSPPPDLLYCSLYELWAMGAIDNRGQLTSIGAKMTLFPMEPTLAKLIILSSQKDFSCSSEVITIVSMLSVPSVFYRPKERASEADAAREKFLIAELDHLTLLNVYTQWEQRAASVLSKQQKLSDWCKRNFLQHRSLLRARDVRRQLVSILQKNGSSIYRSREDADIRRCICAAYFHQLARLVRMGGNGRGQAEYANLRQLYIKMYLHPTSALIGGRELSPHYVVYDELVLTKKEYIQCATAVEPEWLLQYGQVFFGVSPLVRKELEQKVSFKILDRSDWERQMDLEVKEKKTASQEDQKERKKPSFRAF